MVDLKKILKYGSSLYPLLWAAAAQPAADGTNTLQVSVSETVGYDDNLFRLPSRLDPSKVLPPGSSKTDVINQLSVGGKINYAVSRQKFLLDLHLSDNRFANNQSLNNTSTNDRATWQWEFGRQLSGNAGYGYRRSLASFAYTPANVKDIITDNDAFVDVNYTWHPRWRMTSGARWHDSTHSNRFRAILDMQSVTGLIGLHYVAPSNNSTGMEYRFTDVDLPNRLPSPDTLIGNHYQAQTISAVLAWRFTEKTRLDGRFGYTSLENRQFSERDFSGETWRLTVGWAPTAKMKLSLAGWRELQPSELVNASYVVSEGVSFSPVWSPTSKMAIEVRVAHETFDYEGSPGLLQGVPGRQDTLWSGRVAAAYSPVRNAEINIAYLAQQRDSTTPLAGYTDNSVFASAKLQF